MAKNTYSISDSIRSDQDLSILFLEELQSYAHCPSDIEILFRIAISSRSLFPSIIVSTEPKERLYLRKWIKKYADAFTLPPHKRTALPKKSCSDPAAALLVQTAKCLTEEETIVRERHHNLFMSAENAQGALLEEYIAGVARPYGWIWCAGNALRSVDFCNTDGTVLLQIKNRSNTENSSSSAIRAGTTILKWYRLGTKTVSGKKQPCYFWAHLEQIVNKGKTEGHNLPSCRFSEENYQSFLIQTASANRGLLTDQ